MPVLEKNLLNPRAAGALESNPGADRSALLADVLRHPQHNTVRLRVFGESMLPSLWPGDEVEIVSCSLADLRPGEIALALRAGQFFLHRFMARTPNGFVLRGDSMPGADPVYPVEALLGRLGGRDGSRSKWFRAAGWFLCHCGVARRLALSLHQPRQASGRLGSEAGAS
jgi:hypothetical protein